MSTITRFHYLSCCDISIEEDRKENHACYTGKASAEQFLNLSTSENVRTYLAAAGQRKVMTAVHRAMMGTLGQKPTIFSILNGGITLVATRAQWERKQHRLSLTDASIINGSQTQGVLKDFFEQYKEEHGQYPDIKVKFEIIVTQDSDLIAETSIARNFQNDVAALSIVGRLGHLDELNSRIELGLPGHKLAVSETDHGHEFIDTQRLLQVIAALVPEELMISGNAANKSYSYNMKARCLKDFQEIYQVAYEEITPPKNTAVHKWQELYHFYLDIAPEAWLLYQEWKRHEGFRKTNLRNGIKRAADGSIVDISDGIIFPILASMSAFAQRTPEGWHIIPPSIFSEDRIIEAAKNVFIEMSRSNPSSMGRSGVSYQTLYQITSIYATLNARGADKAKVTPMTPPVTPPAVKPVTRPKKRQRAVSR